MQNEARYPIGVLATCSVLPRVFPCALVTLTLGILFVLAAGCTLQPTRVEPFYDPLMAPSPQAPADKKIYHFGPTGEPPTVELVWRHGMPTAQIPSPYQAERIIVCVYEEQRGRCESGSREGVARPIWLEAAADDPAIHRTPIRAERPPFDSFPEMQLGYEFRVCLPMRREYRSLTFLWQVGACVGGTCRLSNPRSLRMDPGPGPKSRACRLPAAYDEGRTQHAPPYNDCGLLVDRIFIPEPFSRYSKLAA
jgi:hypothetical protein